MGLGSRKSRLWGALVALLLSAPTAAHATDTEEGITDAACATPPCDPGAHAVVPVDVRLRTAEGQRVLRGILGDDQFWATASVNTYKDRLYDEIRMKPADSGFVPLITGEGKEDFPLEVVADIVFSRMTDLPKYMDGAKAVVELGSGHDPEVGADYRDTYYYLDLTWLYVTYPQRMYRRYDAANERTILWFERIDSSFVPPEQWTEYERVMQETNDSVNRRALFGGVNPVGPNSYGMFIVSPGTVHTTRVTFVTKLAFGSDAGFMARMGSKMPAVIKSGLRSGFNASVAIAHHETLRRQK